jgi:ribosomal protein S18 acetylase RimI-like enzyme
MSETIRQLRSDDFDALHHAFNEAFGDYVVTMSISPEQLREMLTRRGWVPEASAAAFEDGRIVGFVVNGIDHARGYNSGTGVVPSHRRRGLAAALMERSFDLLRGRGVTRYLLESMESNEPAVTLYRRLGFTEERRLQCWSYAGQALSNLPDLGRGMLSRLSEFGDVKPAWQNETASLRRARARFAVLGDARGLAVVFPATGDLPQIAVRRDSRRKGLGGMLLDAAAAHAGKPLRIINVDDRDAGVAAFFEHMGATRTVRQIEMARAL